MAQAVAGNVAVAAEYNNVVNNVLDLNDRVTDTTAVIGTGVFTETDTVSAWATSAQSQLTTLANRKQPGGYYGEWTDNNAQNNPPDGGQLIDTAGEGEKLTVYTNAVGTPTGMSMSGGTVTVTNAGLYQINASIQLVTNSSTLIAMWIAKGSGASSSGVKYGPTSGYRSDVLSASGVVRLAANGTVSVYAAVWQGTPAIRLWRANGNNLSVTYLGP